MGKEIVKRKEGKDVLLSEERTFYLVDVSPSMDDRLGEDPDTGEDMSKLAATKKALHAMVNARMSNETADQVAVLTFGHGQGECARVAVPLGICGQQHLETVMELGNGYRSGTPLYQALELAARKMANEDGLLRFVLVTDGKPNEGYGPADVRLLCEKLGKEYGFVIDCIGIGRPNRGDGAFFTDHYDEKLLRDCAQAGHGEFYPIDDVPTIVKRLITTARERKALLGRGILLLGDASTI